MRRKSLQPQVSEFRNTPDKQFANSRANCESTRSTEELLQELQVHQIELEMQNDQLRLAQQSLEEQRDRYLELYDFAPCGYLTLNDAGLIDAINLTGAGLLGEGRRSLDTRRFGTFIVEEDKDRWYRFFLHAMKIDTKQSCELSLRRIDGQIFYARLECIRLVKTDSSKQLRISIVDQSASRKIQLSIDQNVTDLEQAQQDIEKSRSELRGLASRNESVREDERKHIAREVHDELGQLLTGLQMQISMLSSTFGQYDPALNEQLQVTLEMANQSLAVARNVAATLRPASLDMGIVSAIEWLTEKYSRNTSVKCEIQVLEEDRDILMDENTSNVLFRIAQESLTNILRHAKATEVEIKLGQQDNSFFLEIKDNGCGFDQNLVSTGKFGLVGIRERVLSLDGTLTIQSAPGKGTSINVQLDKYRVEGKK
jgi:signal transduction histidine kinase